jgi:hypothetical protein
MSFLTNIATWANGSALGSKITGAAAFGTLGCFIGTLYDTFIAAAGDEKAAHFDLGLVGANCGVLAGLAYNSYEQFDAYNLAASALCGVALFSLLCMGAKAQQPSITKQNAQPIKMPPYTYASVALGGGAFFGTLVCSSIQYVRS